jgi:hypothetical protein
MFPRLVAATVPHIRFSFAIIVGPGEAGVKPQNVVVFEERSKAQGFARAAERTASHCSF